MTTPAQPQPQDPGVFRDLPGQDVVVAQLRRAAAGAAALLAGQRPGGGAGGTGGPPVRRRCGDVPPEQDSRAR